MTARTRYIDITHNSDTAEKVAAHAPSVTELKAAGMTPLCTMVATYSPPMYWSVLVDADARVAASVTVSRGRPNVYVASCLVDGTVLETQWRPQKRILLDLGPSVWVDDRPAKRVNRHTPRTIAAVLEAHAQQLRAYAGRSPTIPWTAAEYLRFRRASGSLMTMNSVVRMMVSVLFVFACAGTLIMALLVRWHGWKVTAFCVAAFVLAVYLFLDRLGLWVGGFVARRLSLRVRERLERLWRQSDEDE